MPHVILEYADTIAHDISVQTLVACVHEAVSDSQLFDTQHIKTRALSYNYYQVGTKRDRFIHVQIRLHTGRTLQQKQALSQLVVEGLSKLNLRHVIITTDIVEMNTESYAKLQL